MDEVILKSLSFEGIHEGELRKFSAWGSVEVEDRHGEVIPIEEVYKIMDIWMSRDAPIMLNHTSQKVGKGLNWTPKDKDGKPGVLITGFIHKNYSEDDKVWEGIKRGDYEGLSIGGKAMKVQKEGKTYLENLIGYEFSVVERTGNQEATFVDYNLMAKSENQKMVTEEKTTIVKAEEEVSTETPETSVDDRVARLEEAVGSMMEKLNSLIESQAGEPEEEVTEAEKAEEEPTPEEEPEETEKAEEEVKEEEESEDMKKTEELESLKKELAEIKKQLESNTVVEVAKSEMPSVKSKEEKQAISFTDVMKGKVSLKEFTTQ